MKIRTKKDVESLKDTINIELGIDLSQYKDPEVAKDIVDLILFPKYLLKKVLGPILIFTLFFIAGFFVLDLVHMEYLIYFFVGFILFFLVGLFAGILLLTRRLREDVEGIVVYSMNIMESSLEDIDEVEDRITPENRKDVFGLLFQGIIHIVTIPMLSDALDKRMAFIGSMAKGFIKRALVAISDRVTFDEDNIDENIQRSNEEGSKLDPYITTISNSRQGIKNNIQKVSSFISIPFRVVFWISTILLILFIYLID